MVLGCLFAGCNFLAGLVPKGHICLRYNSWLLLLTCAREGIRHYKHSSSLENNTNRIQYIIKAKGVARERLEYWRKKPVSPKYLGRTDSIFCNSSSAILARDEANYEQVYDAR